MLKEAFDRTPGKWRKFWLLAPVFFIGFVLLAGWAVMFLWNFTLPEVVGWKPLNFQQALALLVLCRILFGGFRGGGPRKFGPRGGKHWMGMSEEDRAKMRAEWAERCRRKNEE